MIWRERKARLSHLLDGSGEEMADGLALDRILHGQLVIGKTSKTTEIDELRFSNRDLELVGTLEHGQFGTIDVVNCLLDGRVYVRKSIAKSLALRTRDQCSPQTERDILLRARKSHAPWAPRLLCAFHTPTDLHILMDYAPGGTLWDVLESNPTGRVSEEDLRWWSPQIVSAIHWCHSQGYVHRDIKPHNFVLTSTSHILLIDFGSAAPLLPPQPDGAQLVPKRYCLVPCGTCDYISPEILLAHEEALVALEMQMTTDDNKSATATIGYNGEEEGSYGRETDWWSFGAMLYEMAYGVAPFFAKDIGQTYIRIMNHATSLHFDNSTNVAPELQNLLQRLLKNNEQRLGRRDIMDVTDHPFFNGVDWATLHLQPAPAQLHLPQFTYSTPSMPQDDNVTHRDDESYSRPFAFSGLFQSSPVVGDSPGLSILRATPDRTRSRSLSHEKGIASFIGFSWGPPANAFDDAEDHRPVIMDDLPGFHQGSQKPDSNGSQPVFTSVPVLHDYHHYATPLRPCGSTKRQPHTLPRPSTAGRSASRSRRPVSDREAMKQLADCIEMSARKKVLESGRKPRLLSRRRSTAFKKELRFVEMPPIVVDAVQDDLSATSGETDMTGELSPSPTPRPVSAMSMLSRRSSTPTVTGSYSLQDTRPRVSVRGQDVWLDPITNNSAEEQQHPLPSVANTYDILEQRHFRLMDGIAKVEERLDDLKQQLRGEG